MSARQVKTHLIGEQDSTGRHIRTVCGKEGYQCRGWPPSPGAPGEYDTPTCDRFAATGHVDDVTCQRCARTALNQGDR